MKDYFLKRKRFHPSKKRIQQNQRAKNMPVGNSRPSHNIKLKKCDNVISLHLKNFRKK